MAAAAHIIFFLFLPSQVRAEGATAHFNTPGFPRTTPGYDQNPDKAWLAEPGNPASKTCDGDFMNTIFNKAYLNAQQDVLMNQLIIRKPDSILEYTCFDQMLGVTAHAIAPIFSETQELASFDVDVGSTRGPRIINTGYARPLGSMQAILQPVVYNVMLSYLQSNFWHTYLGGTAPAAAGGPATFPATANYVCTAMTRAWEYAKCYNFVDSFYPQASDKTFYEFRHLVGFDPRIYPDPLTCNDSQITQAAIDASENVEFTFARFQPPLPPTADSYQELTAPGTCDDSTPIATGLTVHRSRPILQGELPVGSEPYTTEEYICTNPNCHYDGEGACVP